MCFMNEVQCVLNEKKLYFLIKNGEIFHTKTVVCVYTKTDFKNKPEKYTLV